MGDPCERDHSEMRRDVAEHRIALVGVSKDLETVKSLLTAMTQILQDSMIQISAHGKTSTDWRGTFLATVENVLSRVDEIERAIMEDLDEVREKIGKGAADSEKNGKLLRGILGLENLPNPLPLTRDVKEMLALLRAMNDKDHEGNPTEGWAWWAPRFREAWGHAIAMAVLAAIFYFLSPYLATVFRGH